MLELAVTALSVSTLMMFFMLIALAVRNSNLKSKLKDEVEISQTVIDEKLKLERKLEEVTEERDGYRARYSN